MNTSLPLRLDHQIASAVATIAGHQAIVGAAAALGIALLCYKTLVDDGDIKRIRGWPLLGHWAFFTKRHDFILGGFQQLRGQPMFGFSILKNNVVALKGEEARKAFFDRRDLDFNEGYRLLLGGNPKVKDIVKVPVNEDGNEQSSSYLQRLYPLLRMERLAAREWFIDSFSYRIGDSFLLGLAVAPQLMADLERGMVKWGDEGKFDPFDTIFSTIFQLTTRFVACREIADSIEGCKRLEKLYRRVEKGWTPASILLPWMPSFARVRKTIATGQIYFWFDGIIKARQQENRREEDALQTLLDLGDSTAGAIEFILHTLFAGILNTGLMGSWLFIYLDQAPEWRAKVIEELKVLLDTHAPLSGGYTSAAERFSCVPLDAWETQMPVLDLCLRETIRMVMSGAALRRVVHGDLKVEGKTIPNGSFLVYLLGETHQNPDIYPEPSKFNPDRFEQGQDKAQAHAFLGWGVGRHPCPGRRFAQYEIKASYAMFLASYEYEVVNSKGARPDPSVVVPNRNDLFLARPKNEELYIKYTKRERAL
ncbi:hypothetical protein FRC08_014724 [Ceratobasidium sp. 394]|nr:hypothetical protein FRC08_014724 [Ceratobasidium sp. 394]